MHGTSVTVVLIGAQTATRKWVRYEIEYSLEKGNALLGVYIHNIKDKYEQRDKKGANPFQIMGINARTYDWVEDDGYNNLGSWIEEAYDIKELLDF